MWGAAILAFLQAVPELVGAVKDLVAGIKNLRDEALQREIAGYKAQVSADIKKIMGATTNEERLRLADALSRHIGQ